MTCDEDDASSESRPTPHRHNAAQRDSDSNTPTPGSTCSGLTRMVERTKEEVLRGNDIGHLT